MAEYRERQNVQIKKQSVYLKQSQVLGKDYRPQRFTALDMFVLFCSIWTGKRQLYKDIY
jgi:hypothetical protein